MERKKKNICIKRKGKHETKYKYCISDSDLPEQLKVDEDQVLGQGSYGVVLGASVGEQDLALKIIPLEVMIPSEDCGYVSDGGDCIKFTKLEFAKEVQVSKKFGELGITPVVLFSEIVNLSKFKAKPKDKEGLLPMPEKIGVIVMERFGMSLEKIILSKPEIYMENKDLIYRQTLKILKKIFDLGYFSMDAHFGNILFETKSQKVKLIDLDLVPIQMSWEAVKQNFERSWEYFETRNYIKAGILEDDEHEDDEEEQDEDEN
jgi:hypothetical protein